MSQRPEPMTDRPTFLDSHSQASKSGDGVDVAGDDDVLSQVLQLIRLRGERVYVTEAKAPWHHDVPPGVSHVHFVERGQLCVEARDDETTVLAGPGDLVLLPHGRGHTLATAEAKGEVRFIGCVFRYEALPVPPIVAALPAVVRIDADDGAVPRWQEAVMQHLLFESTVPKPGSTLMISRMIDLLVIRTLRTWAERHPRPSAALRDDRIAKVLRAIHGEPEQAWTLESLAQRAAMSRSAFTDHFAKLVGDSPLRYLTRWRLSLADELLRSGAVGVAEAAHRVGYGSEAAFSRAFKAHHGYAPNAAKP